MLFGFPRPPRTIFSMLPIGTPQPQSASAIPLSSFVFSKSKKARETAAQPVTPPWKKIPVQARPAQEGLGRMGRTRSKAHSKKGEWRPAKKETDRSSKKREGCP